MTAERHVEMARCECCGLEVPYWTLDTVVVELPFPYARRHLRVYEERTIVRLECEDCREDSDG